MLPPRINRGHPAVITVQVGLPPDDILGQWAIPATVYGSLAVHRATRTNSGLIVPPMPRYRRGLWRVTHIPSGYGVIECGKEAAHEIARALGGHPWWGGVTPKTPKAAIPPEIRAVLAEIGQLRIARAP